MRKLLRFAILACGAGAFLMVGTGVALAATAAASGFLVVKVHEKGSDGVSFTAPVPVALIDAGLGIASLAAGDELDEARRHLEGYESALRDIVDELDQAESFTLVAVDGDDETVRVRKEGRNLVVDVDDSHTTVHVTLPIRLARRVLGTLAS